MKHLYLIGTYLLVGIFTGWILFDHDLTEHLQKDNLRGANAYFTNEVRVGQGRFTNPLLECGFATGDSETLSQLEVSRFELNALADDIRKRGEVSELSIYLRDLNNGPWIGINEREQFLGASLLKVPLLIAYLKWAEEEPSILKKQLFYERKEIDAWQYFKPERELEKDRQYTVEELLDYMISYSDNNAAALLNANINPNRILETFSSLGMGLPEFNEPYPVNTKVYAGFFRVLYNASYLTKKSSEQALEILTHARFNKGIAKPIPDNIPVAHKFGIRGDLTSADKQLHDCGIIYHPKNPYLLCVMTQGNDYDTMAEAIQEVSSFVYGEVLTNNER